MSKDIETELMIGNHRYIDLKPEGVGGAAVGYRAIFEPLDYPVFVKVLRPEHNGDSDGSGNSTKDKFYREAELTCRLQSPYIVKVHDFDTGDPIKIVYDFVKGLDLRDVSNLTGAVSDIDTLIAMEWVCSALEEAHFQGIIHRDISPSNIIIPEETRRAMLTDFGIAASKEQYVSGERDAEFVGVRMYSSPNQQNRGQADAKDDQYSLGRTAVHLITGRNPIRVPLRQRRLPIHKDVLRMLRKMTATSEERRYGNMKAVSQYDSMKDVRHDVRGQLFSRGVETVGDMESRLGALLKTAYSCRDALDTRIDSNIDEISFLSTSLQEAVAGKDSLRLLPYDHRETALSIFEKWFVENIGDSSALFNSLNKIKKMKSKDFVAAYNDMYDTTYGRNPEAFREQVSEYLDERLSGMRSDIGTLLKVDPQGYKRFLGKITEQVEKTLQANDGDFIFRQESDAQSTIFGAYRRAYNMVTKILMQLEPQNPLHEETAGKVKSRMDELDKHMKRSV